MKDKLDRITKRFLLNEEYDPTTLSSIQTIFEMLSSLRIATQRDTNRVEIATPDNINDPKFKPIEFRAIK